MIIFFTVGWIGKEFDDGGIFVAIFGEEIAVIGIFFVGIKKKVAKPDGRKAIGVVFFHDSVEIVGVLELRRMSEIFVKIIFVISGCELGDFGLDAFLRVQEKCANYGDNNY